MYTKKKTINIKRLFTFISVIVVLIVILTVGIASYIKKQASNDMQNPFGDSKEYEINEVASIGNLDVIVYDVKNTLIDGDDFLKTNYVLVYWKITNISNTTKIIWQTDFLLLSNKGNYNVYDYSYNISDMGIKAKIELPAGGMREFVTVFESPSTKEVEYSIRFSDIANAEFALN